MTGRATVGAASVAVLIAPLLLIGLLASITAALGEPDQTLDVTSLPPAAAQLLPRLRATLDTDCPELPLAWTVAIAQVESGWKPAAYNPAGRAAGLYQLTEPAWTSVGGAPWPSTPPPADAPVFQPDQHLSKAITWLCRNLRLAAKHLHTTSKPTNPLDALLVCQIAGCDRVLHSVTGVPSAGEAGCDGECVAAVHRYITDVHAIADRITRPDGPADVADLPTPAPYTGSGSSCGEPDPSTHGCITPTMRHTLDQILAAFGQPGPDQPIHAYACWDRHAWNPTSDHPKGQACDLFPTRAGTFPTGTDLANGWRIATWLRTHAAALDVKYLIWQGRFWSPTTGDHDGWGKPYDGGGIYNPRDATGGHYDHIHVSVTG